MEIKTEGDIEVAIEEEEAVVEDTKTRETTEVEWEISNTKISSTRRTNNS